MQRFYWVGYTEQERTEATRTVARLINAHGALVGTNFFSDLSTSFVIEIPLGNVDDLYLELNQYIRLEPFDLLRKTGSAECLLLLNLTFAQGTGTRRQAIPHVPG